MIRTQHDMNRSATYAFEWAMIWAGIVASPIIYHVFQPLEPETLRYFMWMTLLVFVARSTMGVLDMGKRFSDYKKLRGRTPNNEPWAEIGPDGFHRFTWWVVPVPVIILYATLDAWAMIVVYFVANAFYMSEAYWKNLVFDER